MQTNILENAAVMNFPLAQKKNFSIKYRFLFGSLWFFCLASMIFLVIFCIFQVNAEISARYAISRQKFHLQQINDENSVLEAKLLATESIENIYPLIAGLNFEKVGQAIYIKAIGNQMVSK